MEKKLRETGIADSVQLAGMTLEQLTAIEGVGEKTAQRLLESAAAVAAKRNAAQAEPPPAPEPEGPAAPEAPGSTDAASEEEPPREEPAS
jgi:hypothetical protein